MGKEAKIGLAVILILLITFGVVLGKRLTGTADETAKEDKSPTEANVQTAKSGTKAKSPGASNNSPRVVVAQTASSQPPKTASAAWSVAADRDKTGRPSGTDQAKASPPYLMPKHPAPPAANPYPAYGNAQQPSMYPPANQTGPNSAASRQPYDPFRTLPPPPATGPPSQPTNPAGLPDATGQAVQQANTGQPILRVGAGQAAQRAGTGQTTYQSGLKRQTLQSGDSVYGQGGTRQQGSGAHGTGQSPRHQHTSRPISATSTGLSPISERSTITDRSASFGPTSTGSGLRREDGTYEVQPNDSYWVISEKLYGSGAYFKALAEHNRDQIPREDQLQVGDAILAPELSELEKTYPGLCPEASRREILRNRASTISTRHSHYGRRTYAVQEGDTLFDIARHELKKASRWPEIHELNRDVLGNDYDLLTPGLELVLPDDGEASDTITRRPGTGSVYQ